MILGLHIQVQDWVSGISRLYKVAYGTIWQILVGYVSCLGSNYSVFRCESIGDDDFESCCMTKYTTIAYSHGISANIGARTSSLGSNCSVFWRASIGTDDFGFCTSEYTTIAYSQAKSVNIEAFTSGSNCSGY